jgi:hypothetical protein
MMKFAALLPFVPALANNLSACPFAETRTSVLLEPGNDQEIVVVPTPFLTGTGFGKAVIVAPPARALNVPLAVGAVAIVGPDLHAGAARAKPRTISRSESEDVSLSVSRAGQQFICY